MLLLYPSCIKFLSEDIRDIYDQHSNTPCDRLCQQQRYLVSTHVVGCDVEVVGTWGVVGTWYRILMCLTFTIVRSSISVVSAMSTNEHNVTVPAQILPLYNCSPHLCCVEPP